MEFSNEIYNLPSLGERSSHWNPRLSAAEPKPIELPASRSFESLWTWIHSPVLKAPFYTVKYPNIKVSISLVLFREDILHHSEQWIRLCLTFLSTRTIAVQRFFVCWQFPSNSINKTTFVHFETTRRLLSAKPTREYFNFGSKKGSTLARKHSMIQSMTRSIQNILCRIKLLMLKRFHLIRGKWENEKMDEMCEHHLNI